VSSLVAGQPATDGPESNRADHPYAVQSGPATMPSRRSRTISAGWLALLIVGLGAVAALGIAIVVVVAWAFISSAVS
jgi:hypothetical protein